LLAGLGALGAVGAGTALWLALVGILVLPVSIQKHVIEPWRMPIVVLIAALVIGGLAFLAWELVGIGRQFWAWAAVRRRGSASVAVAAPASTVQRHPRDNSPESIGYISSKVTVAVPGSSPAVRMTRAAGPFRPVANKTDSDLPIAIDVGEVRGHREGDGHGDLWAWTINNLIIVNHDAAPLALLAWFTAPQGVDRAPVELHADGGPIALGPHGTQTCNLRFPEPMWHFPKADWLDPPGAIQKEASLLLQEVGSKRQARVRFLLS
jgi:hypothetical protein